MTVLAEHTTPLTPERLTLLRQRARADDLRFGAVFDPARRDAAREADQRRLCAVAGCDRPVAARGMCMRCYQRQRAKEIGWPKKRKETASA